MSRRPTSTWRAQEARDAGLLDRIDFVDGDFVRRAAETDEADIVTLDRVVCCYPDATPSSGCRRRERATSTGSSFPGTGWLPGPPSVCTT